MNFNVKVEGKPIVDGYYYYPFKINKRTIPTVVIGCLNEAKELVYETESDPSLYRISKNVILDSKIYDPSKGVGELYSFLKKRSSLFNVLVPTIGFRDISVFDLCSFISKGFIGGDDKPVGLLGNWYSIKGAEALMLLFNNEFGYDAMLGYENGVPYYLVSNLNIFKEIEIHEI